MTNVARKLYEEALTLADGDRADLAARLLESLDAEIEAGVESAWRDEVARRIHALDTGETRPIPWEEAEEMIFGDLGGAPLST